MRGTRSSSLLIIAVWTLLVGMGIVWMTDYSSRPGQSAISPGHIPTSIFGAFRTSRPTLLIFLHPQCPCSRATIAELARITADNPGLAEFRVFFYQPSGQPREWAAMGLWHTAMENPDVKVSAISVEQLKEFDAVTSGQALLYDAKGDLVFSGGITPGRGHEGDNAGRESIDSYLKTGKTTVSETLVFGCSLSTAD